MFVTLLFMHQQKYFKILCWRCDTCTCLEKSINNNAMCECKRQINYPLQSWIVQIFGELCVKWFTKQILNFHHLFVYKHLRIGKSCLPFTPRTYLIYMVAETRISHWYVVNSAVWLWWKEDCYWRCVLEWFASLHVRSNWFIIRSAVVYTGVLSSSGCTKYIRREDTIPRVY